MADKRTVALQFINELLNTNNRPLITDFDQFKDIPKSELISAPCKQLMVTYYPKLFGPFSKTKFNFCKRDTIKDYILTVIKYIAVEFGYKVTTKSIRHQKEKVIYYENYLTSEK